MNRIVREHCPVSQLPKDIRREFAAQNEVTLIVGTAEELRPHATAGKAGEGASRTELHLAPVQGSDASRFRHLQRDHFQGRSWTA